MTDILIFDSGVGGLSIYQEVRCRLKEADISYVSDNAFYPYGTKDPEVLLDRIKSLFRDLVAELRPQLIIIACNTASTIALPALRKMCPQIDIVGVVPAIKPAAQASQSKVIGLLATPATVSRMYIEDLINSHAEDCHVVKVGSGKLVAAAEAKLRGEPWPVAEIKKELAPFIREKPDTIVLGCTHFPLLREEIESCLPGVKLVDSTLAIGNRVASLLQGRSLQSSRSRAVFTLESRSIDLLKPYLGNIEIDEVRFHQSPVNSF